MAFRCLVIFHQVMEKILKEALPNVSDDSLSAYLQILKSMAAETVEDVAILPVKDLEPIPKCHALRLKRFCDDVGKPLLVDAPKMSRISPALMKFELQMQKLPSNLHTKITEKSTLTAGERREFVRLVASELNFVCESPPYAAVKKVAQDITNRFPDTFLLKDAAGKTVADADASPGVLAQRIYNRLKNQDKTKKKVAKRLFANGEASEDADDDQSQNEENQEDVRLKLKKDHALHDHSTDNCGSETVALMEKTRSLRRKNCRELNNADILLEWPCLLASKFMMNHEFQAITNSDLEISEVISKRICEFINRSNKYKKNISNETRKALDQELEKKKNFNPYKIGALKYIMELFRDDEKNIYEVYEVSICSSTSR